MTPRYNCALLTEVEVDDAIAEATERGWPIHPDRQKNWDVVLAVKAVLGNCEQDAIILDAGADRVSTFLPILAKMGYRELEGINLLETAPEYVNGILYSHGNIEELPYPEATVDFIACLSTIEHGVDVPKFLRSANRCLKPGGCLFVSTDYWPEHIETGISNWGILDARFIEDMCLWYKMIGMLPVSDIACGIADRVCRHEGFDYTFFNLLFKRTPLLLEAVLRESDPKKAEWSPLK